MDMKKLQRDEALRSLDTLRDAREGHVIRLKYYLALTGESDDRVPSQDQAFTEIQQAISPPSKDELVMNPQEQVEMDMSNDVALFNVSATGLQTIAGVLKALPNLQTNAAPLGVGASIKFDAGNIAQGMLVGASVLQFQAQMCSELAANASRKAALLRQLQERRLQANLAGRDIQNADIQIKAQQARVAIRENDIKLTEQQNANLTEMDEYLKSKYTNKSLYSKLDSGYRDMYYQMYRLAMDAAKGVKKAFRFERAIKNDQTPYIANSYWDTTRDGLMAAENLALSLRRLENAYQTAKAHDFEISKSISLRQLDSLALAKLQHTGQTQFALNELLFDLDFPGHFCRRIKSLAITIPCIIGPYTSVCCTLRLTSHFYRMEQNPSSSSSNKQYFPDDISMDGRYTTCRVPVTAVAISNAQNDAGSFDLFFNSERRGPFEGAGAISQWTLQLPDISQFDYRSINDVVLHVQYTALDGGDSWRKAATTGVRTALQKSLQLKSRQDGTQNPFHGYQPALPVAMFDLRGSILTRWHNSGGDLVAQLDNVASSLPFWTRAATVGVLKATLVTTVSKTVPSIDFDGAEARKRETPKSADIDIKKLIVFEKEIEAKPVTSIKLTFPGLQMEKVDRSKEGRLNRFILFVTYSATFCG